MGDHETGPSSVPEPLRSSPAQSELVVAQAVEVHSGPLPSPADLKAYGEIGPDFPSRIVAMAESQIDHQQVMDRHRSWRSSAGLAAGFVVAVLFLGVAAWLINDGHEVAGTVLGSFDLVGLVAVFVLGRSNGR